MSTDESTEQVVNNDDVIQNTSVAAVDAGHNHIVFCKLQPNAIIPTRGSPMSAGLDLSSASTHPIVLAPHGGCSIIPTGLAMQLPTAPWGYSYYGRVAPRSGLAVKYGIDVGAGVIDADYRGEIGVVLINTGANEFVVQPGDRVAQLIIELCMIDVTVVEVASKEMLDMTARGNGGFGSTGK